MSGHMPVTVNHQLAAALQILGFALVWFILVSAGRRNGWPMRSWLVLVAATVLAGVYGGRLAGVAPSTWAEALRHDALPLPLAQTFLGMVAVGLPVYLLARRLLRFPTAAGDAFAVALPVGLAVSRIGCLLSGCCFGTPTSLPCAISYPAGSLPHAVHTTRGLVPTEAVTALPVHPVQLYEAGLLLATVLVLLRLRRHLRNSGSLFPVYLLFQAAIRFLIEFVREGEPVNHLLGLNPVQWLMIGTAIAAGIWLHHRERHADPGKEEGRGVGIRTSGFGLGSSFGLRTSTLRREAVILGAAAVMLLLFQGWFTVREWLVVTMVGLPALLAVALATVRAGAPARLLRRPATLALGGSLLMLGAVADSVPQWSRPRFPHSAYYTVGISGATGSYTPICGNASAYSAAGTSLSRTDHWGERYRLEYGLHGFGRREAAYSYPGARVFVKGDSRWFGLGLGASALFDASASWSIMQLVPSASLRLGPRDILFAEARLLADEPGPYPAFRLGLGLEAERFHLRGGLGVFPTGVYLNPEFLNDNGIRLSAIGAYGSQDDYHLGLKLGMSLSPDLKPAKVARLNRPPRRGFP